MQVKSRRRTWYVEYNGRRLRAAGRPRYYHDVYVGGKRRSNWTVLLRSLQPADREALARCGGVVRGLAEDGQDGPRRVISLCCLKSLLVGGKNLWEWSFWTEDLTELEAVREEMREVARG